MLSGFLLSLAVAAADPPTMLRDPPVDRCASDASFAAFWGALLRTIDRRDGDALLAVVAPDIEFSFGGDRGRASFARSWKLSRPQSSDIWRALEETLLLGCRIGEDGTYWAPSFFLFDNGEMDGFETFLALVPGSALRAEPDDGAMPVAMLDWDVLHIALDQRKGAWTVDGDGAAPWLSASLSDGRSGYVRASQVRSIIDLRAGFRKVRGRWMMTVFIAGD